MNEEIYKRHIEMLKERIELAETALAKIEAYDASKCINPDTGDFQKRRDAAWNDIQKIKAIARKGLNL